MSIDGCEAQTAWSSASRVAVECRICLGDGWVGVSARDTLGVRGVGASHGVEECLPLHLAGRSLEFRRVSFERESVIKKRKVQALPQVSVTGVRAGVQPTDPQEA